MAIVNKEKIRIKLEAFDAKLLDEACLIIKERIDNNIQKIVGPVHLPTKKRIYCVLRSPHVNKDAREHFEVRIHKRIMDIYPLNTNTNTSLIGINLPAGVTSTVIL